MCMGRTDHDCAFCNIVAGKTDAHEVYSDADWLAFLDHKPLFPGHTLLVPREHYETLFDLPESLMAGCLRTVRTIAAAMEVGLGAEGSHVAINTRGSQSVPHLHVHVVPRKKGDGLRRFFWPRKKYASPEEAVRVADALKDAIAQLSAGD